MGTCAVLDHTLMENEKAHRLFRVSVCVSLPVSSLGRILEQTFSTTLKIILCTSSRANMMSFPTSTSVAVAVGGFGTLGGADIDIQHSANVISIQFNSIQLHTCHTFVFFLWLRLFQCALSYRAVYQTVILEYGLCRDGSLCMRRGEAVMPPHQSKHACLCARANCAFSSASRLAVLVGVIRLKFSPAMLIYVEAVTCGILFRTVKTVKPTAIQ
jgi:hypothetical protein